MTLCPSNKVIIDLDAICHNFSVIKRALPGPAQKIIAIVKSDAYGHGMVEVSRVLEGKEGLWGFGVSEVGEASILRECGIKSPILLISGITEGLEQQAFDLDLSIGITTKEEILRLSDVGKKLGRQIQCHLKIDTGMTRFGLSQEDALWIIKKQFALEGIKLEGLYSHLACADEPCEPLNLEQINRVQEFLKMATGLGWTPSITHLLNSAGIFHFKQAAFDAVRTGIALYGAIPFNGHDINKEFGLKPALSFKSRIHSLRDVPKGCRVGYGGTWTASRPSKLATIPVGYDNGYLRSLSNRAQVLVGGKRVPVVGRISMRSTVIDVTECGECRVGDEVVLIGKQGDEEITCEELARFADTITYELLCLIGTRNIRVFC
ncbi:Alanine racemase [Dissulfuribacter thermophilus]|uniref:Alanine racemase n=1 Tax=Dissulfuribacter thermophilus TaxID=1156395 RepID=A0A1B9F6A3_9BACT|nr:alanine racemase [Dissulfuribacter thermophilus]OCC15446.1 Alanine racemase [Dissulfuribacter thermophilus]